MNQKVLTIICLKNILVLQHLQFWQKKLYETEDKNKNNDFVNVIKSGLGDLKDDIEKMSEGEKKLKNQIKYQKLLKKFLILKVQKESRQGLNVLTPDQMLSKLPITLAQIKAGNNTEKFKNEVRLLLYSLCRLKNFQNNSINI